MKKVLYLILAMLMIINTALAEKLPDAGYTWEFNATHNPIYYKYMDDYMNQLGETFEKEPYNFSGAGTVFFYTIKRDGTITDIRRESDLIFPLNKKMDRDALDAITNTHPPAFYEGMEEDEIHIRLYLGIESYDETYLEYFQRSDKFWVGITKKRRPLFKIH